MTDPLTLAIVAAAAGTAVELTGQPIRDGIIALGRRVRDRFRGRPDEVEILEGAIAEPDDNARIASLAELLRQAMAEDPAFADEMEAGRVLAMEDPEFRALISQRLQQVRMETTVSDDGVSIVFNGNANNVVQIREVQGDLNIG